MAKIQYMVTEDYVRDWTIIEALREIVSNGIDAEVELAAPLNVLYNPRSKVFTVRNERAKIDVRALYFGGTSKTGNTALVGQYGEGLKLALLVFARNGTPIKVHNDDEDWTAKIEEDGQGVRVLTVYTRKAQIATGAIEMEIGTIEYETWETVKNMFLRLLPSQKSVKTSHGSILLDTDRVGKYYAKGVFIGPQNNAAFGYDFNDLNVGRDRRSFSSSEAEVEVTRMWDEALTRSEDVIGPLFEALKSDAKDLSGFIWMSHPALSKKLVEHFHEAYGEDAYPVFGTAECAPLDFIGLRGVVLPRALVLTLRRALPAVETLQFQKSREVQERYDLDSLSTSERENFLSAMSTLRAVGVDLTDRTVVVRFGDDAILGQYTEEETRVSRKVLSDWGDTVVTLVHEAAHAMGGDGSHRHVSTEEALMAKVINHLRAEKQEAAG